MGHSLYKLKDNGGEEITGVVVPQEYQSVGNNQQKHLLYNLAPLNLGERYSLEMNVRGAALNGTAARYLLSNTGTTLKIVKT